MSHIQTAVAVLARQTQTQSSSKDVNSQFMYDFFDAGGKGKLTQVHILKSQLATQLTAPNAYRADF